MESSFNTNLSTGLSESQAQKNLRIYGKNILAEKTTFIFFRELFLSFFNPLILLLLGASFISALLGDVTDFLIIFGIVVVSGCISFFQHFKAENASERLRSKVVLTATVVRDSRTKEIPFSHVTVGDLVLLSVGDLVPADMHLFETKEVSIDESSLTGESYPAEKDAHGSAKNAQLAFAGTHVATGEAKGIVITIGKQTEIGKLSENITEQKPKTAFDREIQTFSVLVIRLILILCAFVFGVNALFHHNILSSFLFAVALAVGLTPELMPVIITVSLSTGALLMEKKEVIVKFLPGIQNFGGMDILCMDKTGTITENNITLSSNEDGQGKTNENLLFYAKLNSHFQAGFKNPLDQALLAQGIISPDGYTKRDEIPFDFERKKLSVVLTKNDKALLITKGAPLKILENCTKLDINGKVLVLSSQKLSSLRARAQQLAEKGFRVIAIAKKSIETKSKYSPKDEENLVFLGFVIFSDPVKKTVEQTLKKLKSLGITAKILTGDNAIITKKTCLDAGIPVDHILEGTQIQHMSRYELVAHVEETTIFASLTPIQKSQIIQAFRAKNHVVGFLGDGINDAPPLKAADIGISVNNGSDIAKDVADIILMRKSLNVLCDGVLEGRKTYGNTFKYIMMSLSSNFGNMISVALASLFLPFLPLLPVQIILLDFLYDLSQITVPSDNVDAGILTKPQTWSLTTLKRFTFFFGPISSVFDILTFIVLLYFLHTVIPVFRTGWFIESFITQTLIIFAIRTRKVPFFTSRPSMLLITSSIITLGAGILLAFSPIGSYFSFVRVPLIFFFILVFEVLFYFIFVEVAKLFFYQTAS